MSGAEVPAVAVEAAAKMNQALYFSEPWESLSDFLRNERLREAELILEAAAPHMLAGGKVATEEELDALPVGSVVLSEEVTHHEGGWPLSYQRWQDGYWHRGARSGSTHPDNFLPALILHRPAP